MADEKKSAKEIFLAALDKPVGQRAPFILHECDGDEHLQRQVEALLQAQDEPDNLLDQDRIDPDLTQALPTSLGFRANPSDDADQIGRYRLLRKLGQGGMGTVFVAEQREPVQRQVALKIIKAGMDTKEVFPRLA